MLGRFRSRTVVAGLFVVLIFCVTALGLGSAVARNRAKAQMKSLASSIGARAATGRLDSPAEMLATRRIARASESAFAVVEADGTIRGEAFVIARAAGAASLIAGEPLEGTVRTPLGPYFYVGIPVEGGVTRGVVVARAASDLAASWSSLLRSVAAIGALGSMLGIGAWFVLDRREGGAPEPKPPVLSRHARHARQRATSEAIDLRPILRTAGEIHDSDAQRAGVDLLVDGIGDLTSSADARAVSTTLSELIRAAVGSTARGSAVHVTATGHHRSIDIRVAYTPAAAADSVPDLKEARKIAAESGMNLRIDQLGTQRTFILSVSSAEG